jgi:hypothetical protein
MRDGNLYAILLNRVDPAPDFPIIKPDRFTDAQIGKDLRQGDPNTGRTEYMPLVIIGCGPTRHHLARHDQHVTLLQHDGLRLGGQLAHAGLVDVSCDRSGAATVAAIQGQTRVDIRRLGGFSPPACAYRLHDL